MANITIYTTPTCVFCKMAKGFFKENNVSYEEKDVSTDAEARDEMMQKSGQLGVPVILFSNEGKEDEIVVGFDKERISELAGVGK